MEMRLPGYLVLLSTERDRRASMTWPISFISVLCFKVWFHSNRYVLCVLCICTMIMFGDNKHHLSWVELSWLYAVLWSLCIDDCTRMPHAFIRLQPTRSDLIITGSRASQTDQQGSSTTQSDQELNAVYLKHHHRRANGTFWGCICSPTERYLIGLNSHFIEYWLAICSQQVVIWSHRSLLRC